MNILQEPGHGGLIDQPTGDLHDHQLSTLHTIPTEYQNHGHSHQYYNANQLQQPELFNEVIEQNDKPKSAKNVKKYTCNICGKFFSRSDALNVHKRIHTGERPYPCTYCEKRFYTSSDHKKHERTHTGESPHICEFCDKAFKEKSSLRRHKITHTRTRDAEGKVKNYCNTCGIKFATNVNMEGHKQGTDRTYSCDQRMAICKLYYELRRASALQRHSKQNIYDIIQTDISEKFPNKKVPSERTIIRIVKVYETVVGPKDDNFDQINDDEARNDQDSNVDLDSMLKIDIKEECTEEGIDYFLQKLSDGEKCSVGSEQSCEALSCDICNKTFSNLLNLDIHKWVHPRTDDKSGMKTETLESDRREDFIDCHDFMKQEVEVKEESN